MQFIDVFLRICVCEVESANEDIRPEVGGYVENAPMGASADDDAPAVFFQEQVLFMQEVIWHNISSYAAAHAFSFQRVWRGEGLCTMYAYSRCQLEFRLPDQAHGRVLLQLCLQTYILAMSVEVRRKGMWTDPDGGMRMELDEVPEAAAMVVVTMREHHHVNIEMEPHSGGVMNESIRCSSVEQNAVVCRFDKKAEPMLCY